MRIQRRITLGIGILFTMILLLGIQSVGYVRQLSRATGTILADNYNSLQYAGEMLRSLNDIGQDSISRHALRENLALQQQNITEISEKETTAALERHVASLSDPVTEAEIRTVREDLFRIMELNMAAIRAKSAGVEQRADYAMWWLIAVAALCALIAGGILVWFPQSVLRPIDALKKGITQIANHNSYKNSYQYLAGNAISQTRQTYEGWSQTNRLSFQAHVDYNKSFGDHNLSAMAGYDFLKRKINGMSMTVQGAESDKTPTLGAGTTPTAWTDTQTPWCQISYFGRLNYNYKEKYMLGFTMRADGSSLFAKDNRWGYFPAVSAGWVVSEEKFWNVEKFNQLKLRLSYGLTGNNNVDYYDTLGAYSVTGIYAGSGATLASTLPNLGLTWEKTKQFDIGLDMAFFNNRLMITAEGYISKTRDLLLTVQTASATGYTSRYANIGKTSNKGVELSIESRNIVRPKFSWTTNLTIAHNKQNVDDIGSEDFVTALSSPGNNPYMMYGYVKGYPLNALWGFKYGGTWKSVEEFERNSVTNTYVSALAINSDAASRKASLGMPRYYDINDGSLNNDDLVYQGNADPDLYGGLQNNFRFGRLNVGIYFTYSLGGKIYNYSELYMAGSSMSNQYRYMLDAWHPVRNPQSNLPRAGAVDAHVPSDLMIYDASYIRLKNITVGYTFDLSKRSKFIRDITLNLSAENLHIWKKYNGFDPDVSTDSSDSALRRVDLGAYPKPRTIVFSIQLRY